MGCLSRLNPELYGFSLIFIEIPSERRARWVAPQTPGTRSWQKLNNASMDLDKKRSASIDGKYREITGIYHLAVGIPPEPAVGSSADEASLSH